MAHEKHTFEADDGTEYEFNTEDEMLKFAIRYTRQSLVAKGFGDIVIVNGEECFKINEKGLQYVKDHDQPKTH